MRYTIRLETAQRNSAITMVNNNFAHNMQKCNVNAPIFAYMHTKYSIENLIITKPTETIHKIINT